MDKKPGLSERRKEEKQGVRQATDAGLSPLPPLPSPAAPPSPPPSLPLLLVPHQAVTQRNHWPHPLHTNTHSPLPNATPTQGSPENLRTSSDAPAVILLPGTQQQLGSALLVPRTAPRLLASPSSWKCQPPPSPPPPWGPPSTFLIHRRPLLRRQPRLAIPPFFPRAGAFKPLAWPPWTHTPASLPPTTTSSGSISAILLLFLFFLPPPLRESTTINKSRP